MNADPGICVQCLSVVWQLQHLVRGVTSKNFTGEYAKSQKMNDDGD